MKRKAAFYKAIQTASAIALTMSIAFTGVSAAGAPSRVSAAGVVSEAAQADNQYEAFLGFGKGAYLYGESWRGAVNLWSGNLVLLSTVPGGNAFSKFTLNLTYNSQANCDIGFGNNITVTYWAQLMWMADNSIRMVTGTGTVDTYVWNTMTGRYECGESYIDILSDGSCYASVKDGEYYFDKYGRATKTCLYNSAGFENEIIIEYNDDGTIQLMHNQMGASYEFSYTRLKSGQIVCKYLNQMVLEYDEQGNFLSMGYDGDDPSNKHFELSYEDGRLATHFNSYDTMSPVSVTYQNVNGYDKVVNFNGTQIVYGKNQTITIDPNGTVTTWQFDDEGNLI